MTITFTQVWKRPNTSIQFHTDTDLPAARFVRQIEEEHANVLTPTVTLSDDGLTMTKTQQHQSVDTLNQTRGVYKNADLNWEYYNFTANTGQTQVSYTLSGLPEPFTVTTEYTFPTGANVSYLVNALTSDFASHRLDGNITVSNTAITATHFYINDEYWNELHWGDFMFISQMHRDHVTFKETWALAHHQVDDPTPPNADTPPAPV